MHKRFVAIANRCVIKHGVRVFATPTSSGYIENADHARTKSFQNSVDPFPFPRVLGFATIRMNRDVLFLKQVTDSVQVIPVGLPLFRLAFYVMGFVGVAVNCCDQTAT